MSNHHLHIYKASAGSGKTFTLAVNYICMLIEHPDAYRHILAVTFTNKATAEMKQRIISKLYGIAYETEDAVPYFEAVQKATGLAEGTIRSRALDALKLLVHDYGHFRIETIDSFFQSVLRGLARELDLGTGMTIELDTKKVISEAVDNLMRDLKPDTPTLHWIFESIESKIDDGKPWNITDDLKRFAANIHNEDYQRNAGTLREQLKDPAFIRRLRSHLMEERANAKKRALNRATEFFNIIDAEGLTVDDFHYKSSGVCSYYIKLSKGEIPSEMGARAQDAANSASGWVKHGSPHEQHITILADHTLIQHLNETHKICLKSIETINSCEIIMSHLNQLQLINIIHDQVLQLNKEENRFLLADTCQMLSCMQAGDSAFVFEKLGYYLQHIMIDEFQDTSRMQWENFYPLLLEGLSGGNKSLLVGDVKQAIYRWRGSDWRILNEEVTQALASYTPEKAHHLDTNRRSLEGIVDFNNGLFEQCNTLLAEQLGPNNAAPLLQAYSDVKQKWNEDNKGGYVRITNVQSQDDEDSKDAMCREIAAIIGELRAAGVEDKQIAILARDNKKISHMVDYMTQYHADIKIFSAEAYLLEASTAVGMLIAAMRWIADKHHQPALMLLALDYHRHILADGISPTEIIALSAKGYGLPEELVHGHTQLGQIPLYELGERLYHLLDLKALSHETGYLMAFFDHLLRFCSDATGDINDFLAYWDDELHRIAVPIGAGQGIEAMTIHKSKGLEFHTVILPYCEWPLNKHSETLWATTTDPFANGLATIPIEYKENMKQSIFSTEYNEELLKQAVDNYNLLYVACTRPKCNLFILKSEEKKKEEETKSKGKSSKKSTKSDDAITTVAQLIHRAISMGDLEVKEYGELVGNNPSKGNKKEKKEGKPNPLEAQPTSIEVSMHSEPLRINFRQSNLSKKFLSSVNHDNTAITTHHYIEQGLLLHEVFSKMSVATDAPQAIDDLLTDGIISTDKERKNIERIVYKALEHPQAAEWFSGKYQLYNECTIIHSDAKGLVHPIRPDRVMSDGERMTVVDFKFARPSQKHEEQVQNYMEQLRLMGHHQVEGYLWYVYENKILPVPPRQ